MPTTVKIRRSGTASATPSALEHGEIAINYADGKVFWKNASNVITSFTFQSYALASHTHSISDVTGLQTALDGKASSSHTHSISDVTGLQTALDGKAASSHTHSISDVTGLQTALDGKASSSHTHAASDITSGTLDIARIPTGSSSSTVCIGNDARLSDTRTPTDGSVTTAKIANDAVTYAKIQNVSATDRLLGRSSAGAGDVEEITCTSFGRSLIDDADAAAARTTLSVQPTASPTFTGNARVNSSDSATSLLVNGATKGVRFATSSTATAIEGVDSTGTGSYQPLIINGSTVTIQSNGGTSAITVSTSQTATFAGQILADDLATSNSVVYAFDGDTNTGIGRAGADILTVVTGGTERVRVDASGAVGIGMTPTSLPLSAFSFATSDANKATLLLSGTVGSGQSFAGIRFSHNVFTTGWGADILCVDTGNFGGILSFRTSATGSATATPTERMRIDASGNVGIGTQTTTERLNIVGTSSLYQSSNGTPALGAKTYYPLTIENFSAGYGLGIGGVNTSTGGTYIQCQSFGSSVSYPIYMQALGGEVLIGTTTDNGAYLLQVNSQIYATNATIATSDARFKTNVESLTDATSVIESLRPVAFDFIPQADRNFAAERQVGLIAQEAQAALAGTDYADSVVAQCGDHLGLAYEKLVPVLIRALQESNARIAALEERING